MIWICPRTMVGFIAIVIEHFNRFFGLYILYLYLYEWIHFRHGLEDGSPSTWLEDVPAEPLAPEGVFDFVILWLRDCSVMTYDSGFASYCFARSAR